MEPIITFPDFSMAVELWWVSLTLMTVSLGLGIEVHTKFSDKLRKIRDRRIAEGRAKVKEILKGGKSKEIAIVENEILTMPDYRETASAPREKLNVTVQFSFFASFVFLGSVLVRLAVDNGLVAGNAAGWEWILFILALFAFLIAVFYTFQLMRLVDREGD